MLAFLLSSSVSRCLPQLPLCACAWLPAASQQPVLPVAWGSVQKPADCQGPGASLLLPNFLLFSRLGGREDSVCSSYPTWPFRAQEPRQLPRRPQLLCDPLPMTLVWSFLQLWLPIQPVIEKVHTGSPHRDGTESESSSEPSIGSRRLSNWERQ